MKRFTVDDVLAWDPCDGYGRARLLELFGKRKSITVRGTLRLPIPPADILWAVLRVDVLPERTLHLLACDFAEHVQRPDADPRSLHVIATKRRWVDGAATDAELRASHVAAAEAARDAFAAGAKAVAKADAAWAVGYAEAGYAADEAAYAAAYAAADEARKAERQWQVERVLEMLRLKGTP